MSNSRQNPADFASPDWFDDPAAPAVASFAQDLARGEGYPAHRHRRAQFVFASAGVMLVSTRSAAYLVPPLRAVWMPGGVEHAIEARGTLALRTLYLAETVTASLPSSPCVLQVTPLLRELVVAVVALGNDYPGAAEARLLEVTLDQIAAQPIVPLALPLPRDRRLGFVTDALLAHPGDPRGLDAWAARAGASKRTLNRLFRTETGMSFRDWRAQCRLLHALEMIAAGASVTRIADELGYDHASAFIAMFRRALGTTPHRYRQTLESGQSE